MASRKETFVSRATGIALQLLLVISVAHQEEPHARTAEKPSGLENRFDLVPAAMRADVGADEVARRGRTDSRDGTLGRTSSIQSSMPFGTNSTSAGSFPLAITPARMPSVSAITLTALR